MLVTTDAAKQGGMRGEHLVSWLMFAGDFVGISETPEKLQKLMRKTLG